MLRDSEEIFCDMAEPRSSEPIALQSGYEWRTTNIPLLSRRGGGGGRHGRGEGGREGEKERGMALINMSTKSFYNVSQRNTRVYSG